MTWQYQCVYASHQRNPLGRVWMPYRPAIFAATSFVIFVFPNIHALFLVMFRRPSLSLFLLVCIIVLCSAQQTSQEWFQSFDSNHNGAIDSTEFEAGYPKLVAARSSWWPSGVSFSSQPFWKGFSKAVCMIVATEIGDKTFFIAAILSMKHARLAVLTGALAALFVMTILSTGMGLVLPALMDRKYTHLLGGALFLYFGIKLLWDGRNMEHKPSEELEEVEEELMQTTKKNEGEAADVEEAQPKKRRRRKSWSQVALQSLSLTFVAEWGDRSQIATIALAASQNPIAVTIGGCLGHGLCTGVAVLGGRMVAARISERTVHLAGGTLFLLFGLHSLFLEE